MLLEVKSKKGKEKVYRKKGWKCELAAWDCGGKNTKAAMQKIHKP